jgi:uncharacterized protein YqeY
VSLTERLQADMKSAMRDGDALRRDTLRMAIAAAQNAAKDKRAALTDEETLEVIGREVKKRRESVVAYEGAGREDLAAKERAEIDILTPYLPEPLGEDEIRALAREAVAAAGATSPGDMGRVMSQLMPKVKGRADGKLVSAIVSEELARAAGA